MLISHKFISNFLAISNKNPIRILHQTDLKRFIENNQQQLKKIRKINKTGEIISPYSRTYFVNFP